jgi:hypothetical protein
LEEDKKKLEDRRKQEEEKKKADEDNRRRQIKNPIAMNKPQPRIEENHEIEKPSHLKEINKRYLKDYGKKDTQKKENISPIPIKSAKDYIDKTFKDPKPVIKSNKIIQNEPKSSKILQNSGLIVANPSQNPRTNSTQKKQQLYPDINEDINYMEDSEELIRKLQLQEDEKLARELYKMKLN